MIHGVFLGETVTPPSSESSTRTEVRSPTRTATEVRSPTSTSTEAYTQGNFTVTVTGGAGSGPTSVDIHAPPLNRANTASSKGPRKNAHENENINAPRPDERNSSGNVGMTPAQAAGFPNFVTDVPVQGPTDRGMRSADCYYTRNMLPANPAGCANEGTVPMWARQNFVAPRHFPGIVGERLLGGGVGFALGLAPEVWTKLNPEQQAWVTNAFTALNNRIYQDTGTTCPTWGPSVTAAGGCFQGWFNANMKGLTKADGSPLVLRTDGVFDQDTLDALQVAAMALVSPFPASASAGSDGIEKKSLSKGAMAGIAVGGAAVIGGTIWALTRKKRRS